MTSFIICTILSLLQATPSTRPDDAAAAAAPATQPRTRLLARAAYDRAILMAANAYRREVREAEGKLAVDLEAALKIAMQNGNLTEANRINEDRQQALGRMRSNPPLPSDSPAPGTASAPAAPIVPANASFSTEARIAAREALRTKLADTRWSWPDRSFGNRAHYTLKADGTISAAWHNRVGWWIVASDHAIVAQIGATPGPVLVLFDDDLRKGYLKSEGGQTTERQQE